MQCRAREELPLVPASVDGLLGGGECLLALTQPGLPLTVDRLSPQLASLPAAAPVTASLLLDREKELIELNLRLSGGNRTRTAQNLGISREGLRKKMKRFGLG